ncbi:MAG: GNAT family N-acetyltransferase [Chloroflexi bacterium]|nr:GNAT family N-acetyltransferase [Chloroflexota bacterium]
MQLEILETNRLLLRHLEPDDLDDLFALYQDPDVRRYIPDAPQTLARPKRNWTGSAGHPRRPWGCGPDYKPTNQFIGRCGLLPWTIDGQDEVEVAYTIAPSHWGQGLATEAAQAILDYGFYTLGFTRLVCLIDEENVASIRVAGKMGMAFEKASRDEIGPFWLYTRHRPAMPEGDFDANTN